MHDLWSTRSSRPWQVEGLEGHEGGAPELGCLALARGTPPSEQACKEKFALSREPVLDAIPWWAITGLPKLVGSICYLLAGDIGLLGTHRSDLLWF